MSRESCESCLHHKACLVNSEYVLSPCRAYDNKADYRKYIVGHWVDENGQPVKFSEVDGCPESSCYCDNCGKWLVGSDEYPCSGDFCPSCGADMKGGAE